MEPGNHLETHVKEDQQKQNILSALVNKSKNDYIRFFRKGTAIVQNRFHRRCTKSNGEIEGGQTQQHKETEIPEKTIRNIEN